MGEGTGWRCTMAREWTAPVAASKTVEKPLPPIDDDIGSTTFSVAAVATAASKALPPPSSTRVPAMEASGLAEVTRPLEAPSETRRADEPVRLPSLPLPGSNFVPSAAMRSMPSPGTAEPARGASESPDAPRQRRAWASRRRGSIAGAGWVAVAAVTGCDERIRP